MSKYTAPEIIGTYTCDEIGEILAGRYQPTLLFNPSVYVIGENYYCCPTLRQKPPTTDRDGYDRGFVWKRVWTHEKTGRHVYSSTVADMNALEAVA